VAPACRQGATLYVCICFEKFKNEDHHTGLTEDVENRVGEHNNGWVDKTKFYRPFILVHVEIVENLIEARKMEKYFKSGYGREIIKEIEQESPS
jgi:putative endonuclease